MEEQRIEEMVEKKIDKLDAIFMRGDIDEEEYRIRMGEIDNWSKAEYKKTAEYFDVKN